MAMAFPSAPTITSEMWKGAQNLDVRTLQLSFLECDPPLRRAFSKVADQISGYCESETPILEKIRLWHADGNSMAQIARTNLKGILVPTTHYIRSLDKKNSLALIEIMEEEIKPMRLQYQMLTHKNLDDYLMKIQGQDPRTCSMSWKASTVSHHLHGAWAGFHSPAPAVMDFDALLVAIRYCFQLSGIRRSRFQSTVLSLSCQSV